MAYTRQGPAPPFQTGDPYDLQPEQGSGLGEEDGQPSSDPTSRRNTTMNDTDGDRDASAGGKKPNRLAAFIAKLGLDTPTLITMFK
jgi:hypothetical protein